MSSPRIGYLVKRFPRVSETFIAQEILELERRGGKVHVISLVENDQPARHAWLDRLRAEVTRVEIKPFVEVWGELSRRAREVPAAREGIRRAVGDALEQPQGKGRRYLSEALAVADAMDHHRLSHLHAHFANRPAFVALLASTIGGRSFSFTAHAKDIYRDTVHGEYWRKLLGHAAFAVTVSEANVRHVRELAGPVAEGKLKLLYNGVDLESLRPRAPQPQGSGATPRLLCVARLVEKKGVDTLLEAMRLMADQEVAAECVIAGDGPLAGEMGERASELRLDGRVTFLGSVPHERVIELMGESALVVLPCRVTADGDRDALPTVLLEAMACGLPCVSTPVGGVPEIIEHEKTGLLVPPDRPDELAGALRRLLADDGLRRRMGRAGRQRAEQRFNRRLSGARLHEWLQTAAGSANTSGPGAGVSGGAPPDAGRRERTAS